RPFPYTTLFRSLALALAVLDAENARLRRRPPLFGPDHDVLGGPEVRDLLLTEPRVGSAPEESRLWRAPDLGVREEVADLLGGEDGRPHSGRLRDPRRTPGLPGERRDRVPELRLLALALDRVPPERAADHPIDPLRRG